MATERRRQQLLLGGFVVLLGVVLYRIWPSPSAAPAATSNRQGAPSGAAAAKGSQPSEPAALSVHLDALDNEHPQPAQAERDLFRFRPKAPPPGPTRPTAPTAPVTPAGSAPTTGPPPPPPVPPITLKFIGVMGTETSKLAVLSDGRGAPFWGHEGEVVEGRYRILKIGVESVEIAYADGRGRQTIRLDGR
jgi:hypothetical protein